jgi:hypothetical protein
MSNRPETDPRVEEQATLPPAAAADQEAETLSPAPKQALQDEGPRVPGVRVDDLKLAVVFGILPVE